MKIFSYIQIIISYICYGFIAVYYIFMDKRAYMDWWGIALLLFSIINMFIGLYFLDRKGEDDKKESNLQKILKHVVKLPVYLLLAPFCIIGMLIYMPCLLLTSEYALSKPLRKKGFRYKSERKSQVVLLTKEDVVIKLAYESYKISFNGGETFVDIIDSDLGTLEEKKELRDKMIEYQSASSLSKQRGDVVAPTEAFIIFLNKYL